MFYRQKKNELDSKRGLRPRVQVRPPGRVESGTTVRAITFLVVSELRFRLFYKMILKLFMTCIAFAYKG